VEVDVTSPREVSIGVQPTLRAAADPTFEEFVVVSSARMFTLAMLLCGRHRAEAEDLLQGVLERAYRRWPRICRGGDPERYVRAMLVNASVDRWRRLRRRPELLTGPAGPVSEPAVPDQSAALADRDQLLRALSALPARQRAVIVLRYLEDLTEAQAAAVLGCSEGTVKSQASRALVRLHELTGDHPAEGADYYRAEASP
jgi:RNA polymerase sigma-70 factor (sigma-E family)